MKLLLLKNRFSDVIEIGKFLAKSELFTGSTSMIYSLMMKASEQMQNSRHPSEYEQISKRYIEVLEQEQNNYNAMVRSLTQEELRLMRLRKTMARDSLTVVVTVLHLRLRECVILAITQRDVLYLLIWIS